jgi:hypothetical protein
MRQPSILDMLRAVKQVGSAQAEVRAFWYAPTRKLRLRGEVPGSQTPESVEVVVDVDSPAIDLSVIADALGRSLQGVPVTVRRHRGASEERQLYRLWSREHAAAAG